MAKSTDGLGSFLVTGKKVERMHTDAGSKWMRCESSWKSSSEGFYFASEMGTKIIG